LLPLVATSHIPNVVGHTVANSGKEEMFLYVL